MIFKYRGPETCSKTCRTTVRLAVWSRYASNYDETRTDAKNEPNDATKGILSRRSLK
ncbi:hypothetical protein HanXRQr2_Chr17g0784281 [Helianthus annuus]|uniref:Uncharacterized protein n=1 Tax=Helianthus annuus TaxID=4232 RepID=A0A9K3DFQ1_HELAN|nr:hypothetical protein HanXRQr2_Chr17g0784281 [Helianthus annuus]KAJ0431710.1 hypothetical protein HanIR_Chr17g0851341 [Helianthus annuus]